MAGQYALLLGAGACAIAAGLLASRRYPLAMLVPVATLVIVAWEYPNAGYVASVFGTRLFLQDFLALIFLIDAIRRLAEGNTTPPLVVTCCGVLVSLGIASTVRGLTTHPLGMTVNELRPLAYSFCSAIWAFTIVRSLSSEQMRLLRRCGLVLGWILVAVALYHIARYGLGNSSSSIQEDGIEQTGRPLTAAQAFVLSGLLMMVLWDWITRSGGKYLVSVTVFAVTIVLAQHRSVWISTLVAIAVLLVLSNGRRLLKMSVGLLCSIWITAILYFLGGLNPFLSKLSESATNDKTLEGRDGSALALLTQAFDAGARIVAFGYPFGSGYRRQEAIGRIVDYTPHNWYLHAFLRLGLVGVFALVAFLAYVLYWSLRCSALLASLSSAVLIYAWSYSLPWYIAAVLGAVAAAPTSWGPNGTSRPQQHRTTNLPSLFAAHVSTPPSIELRERSRMQERPDENRDSRLRL